jgi:hypothetical protein
MTDEQARELESLATEFSLAHLVVIHRTGESLFKTGNPTTPWCREAASRMFGSATEAARTFKTWAAQRLPGGGGAGDEGCSFYRPQQNIMVGAFFSGCERDALGRKSKALELRVLDILGAQPDASPNGGPATQSGHSGVTEGPPSVS